MTKITIKQIKEYQSNHLPSTVPLIRTYTIKYTNIIIIAIKLSRCWWESRSIRRVNKVEMIVKKGSSRIIRQVR